MLAGMLTRRKFLPLALLCLVLSPFVRAEGTGPTPYPPPDGNWPGAGVIRVHPWMTDNREFFWTKRTDKQGAVVFVGDSLVGNWKDLERSFPGLKIANRGIGGDVSRGVLFRLKEDVLDLNPSTLVVLIGTNDLSARGSPDSVIANLSAIVAQAKQHNPSLPVVICTVPPRENPKAPIRQATLDELNVKIRALASDQVKILDLFALFSTPEGKPVPDYFKPDLLHLDAPGYAKFKEAVRGLLPAAP
jgi:lysophospholipase L1-like esterase